MALSDDKHESDQAEKLSNETEISITDQQTNPEPKVSLTPFQQLMCNVNHDSRWMHEVALGKRVGFYRFSEEIGSGNFSYVKSAVHQLTKDKVAIKVIEKNKLDAKTRKMLAREISTMESLNHSNIIRLYEVVETYSKIHLVMEYAGGGELFSKISSNGKLTETESKFIFFQIVAAVKHMHNKGFVHRDIKAENVFYAGPNLVKVGDFGFSTVVKGSDEALKTFCGSPPYAAPELFRDKFYIGQYVDIWALGVLLYFMVTGAMPFKANTVVALKNAVLEGKYNLPSHVSESCKLLIKSILQDNPSKRLCLDDILKSEWMSDVDLNEQLLLQDVCMIYPTKGDLSSWSFMEKKARKKLDGYGINCKLLLNDVPMGSKSTVIGLYRILINRYYQEMFKQNWKRNENSSQLDKRKNNKETKRRSRRTCILF